MKILIVSSQRLFAEVLAQALQAGAADIEGRVVTSLDEARAEMAGDRPDAVLVDDELLDGAELGLVRPLFHGVRTMLIATSEASGALALARRFGCSQVIGRGARLADVRAVLGSTTTDMAVVGMNTPPDPTPHRANAAAFGLTPRETQVLRLLTLGAGNSRIARTLAISENTVRTHVQNIFTKLGVSSRLAAATLAIHSGTIPAEPGMEDEVIDLSDVPVQDARSRRA